MDITLDQLRNSFPILQKLALEKFAPAAALRVGRLIKAVAEEHALLEEQRIRLVKTYGDEDENGGFSVSNERYPEFAGEFGKYLAEAAVIDQPSLPISFLPQTIKLTPGEMLALFPCWMQRTSNLV